MAERGFIPIQPKYEEIQFFLRKHWTHFIKPLIFGFLVGALTFLFFLVMGFFVMMFRITFFYSLFAFMLIIVSILFMDIFFLQMINYYFDVVIVTDHRIIVCKKTVFLKNDNDAIDLTKIQDIGVVAHGFLNNYLNYGMVMITLSTSAPPVMINFVPNPHFYLEQMNHVKRANILARQERHGSAPAESLTKPETYLQPVDQL